MARTRLIAGKIIRFEFNPLISMTGVSSASISYIRPDGVSGSWTASVVGSNVVYTTTIGDTQGFFGDWELAANVVKNGGPLQSAPIYETLHKPV